MIIKSAKDLCDAGCDETWQFVWQMHERLTALETAARVLTPAEAIATAVTTSHAPLRPAEDFYRDPNVPYAPHPAYGVAAGWKDKHDQQKERADGLEKELGTVREQLREKTELLHKGTADYRAQYKRAEANQAAADTLDKLRRGEHVIIAGISRRIVDTDYSDLAKLRAERDALAEELADRERTIRAQDDHRLDLQKRLAERDRDAERWRTWVEMLDAEFLRHAWTGKVDAAIAADKHGKQAKPCCPTCGNPAAIESETTYTCPCFHSWTKEPKE